MNELFNLPFWSVLSIYLFIKFASSVISKQDLYFISSVHCNRDCQCKLVNEQLDNGDYERS